MTHEEWQRLKAASVAALDLPEAERQAYLAAVSQGDAAFERELRSLLAATAAASRLFETNAVARAAAVAVLGETASSGPLADRRRDDGRAHGFRPGDLVNNRYRVERTAGRGGMGTVYRVFDLTKQRTLALKKIHGKIRFVDLFKIEFRTLVDLAHPHLARSYDFEAIAGSDDYFFTMDFVDGAGIYEATAGVGWARTLDYLVQVCRALAYVHSRGVVHRDIKPGNVMVQPDGAVRLLDFGLAGATTAQSAAMGTPSYVAPEVRDQSRGDPRSDLYSLGVLTYELLARRLPFSATDPADLARQHASAPIVWPEDVDVPAWLRRVVEKLCAKEPSDRYRSANQIIDAIDEGGDLTYPVETAATRESYVLSGRFVGRDHEVERLSRFIDARLTGAAPRAQPIAFIAGASGVGKSRLTRELRHQAQLGRRVFAEANCFEGATSEYGAIADTLLHLLPLAESHGGRALIGRHASELGAIAPSIGEAYNLPPVPPLASAEAERRRLFDAIAGFLVELSELFPFVVAVDDLQWAPQGTIDILRYVRRRVAFVEEQGTIVRLALLASFREGEVDRRPIEALIADVQGEAQTVRLGPLTAPAMESLLISMFGLDSVPSSFVSRVLDEAVGSPFFLEEVVRGLVETGSVFVEQGAWCASAALGELEIPQSVITVLRRRLAMIQSEDAWDLLRLFAAYKKPMPLRLLTAILHRPAKQIEEALYDLTHRQMITAVAGRERSYRTAHDYLRTTVYGDLGSRSRVVHRGIAQGLQQLFDEGNPVLSELAHHYWAAGESGDALKYALQAGQSALTRYANDEAIEHLEHAIDLLPPDATAARARALEQLADAHFLSGRYDRTGALLEEANRHVVETIDRARIQRKRAEVIGYSLGTPARAVDIMWSAAQQLGATRPWSRAVGLALTVTAFVRHLAQQAILSAVPAVSNDTERRRLAALTTAYLRIATFSFFGDPLAFFLPIFRAANLVDRIPESTEHAQVYSLTAIAVGGLGMPARALRYGKAAIQEARRCGSPWHEANAQSFHAIVLLQTGHWSEALEHAELASAAFAACGDHFELAVSCVALVEVLHARGELAAAKARGGEHVAVFDRLDLQMIGKGLYTVVGRVLGKLGDVEAIRVGTRVLELATRGADKLSTVLAEIALGDSLLQLGRIDEAIEHLEQGLAIRDRDRFDVYLVAEGSALLARAYAARIRDANTSFSGKPRQRFEQRVAQATAAGRRFSPMRSAACLVRGLAHHLAGDPRRAAGAYTEAADLARHLGAPLWEADARLELSRALSERDGGRSAPAREACESALAIYQRCGAVPGQRRATLALSRLS